MNDIIPGAEQSARRTAAAAVLADYQRAAETADVADRAMWAARLAGMLGYVLGPAGAVPRAPAAAPPLETEKQARELPAVRAVWAAFDADPGPGKMYPHNEALLLQACAGAGVTLGAFDRRIVGWLAGWEPTTVAVVVGIITRAAAAGEKRLPAGYESTIGQAFRDAVRWCEAQGSEDLAEQARFYRSIAPALGIRVDPPVTTYRVRARRWEHGWELHIEGVGVTQSHSLDDAERMARDFIEAELDVPAGSFRVDVTPETDGGS